jgi:hypothetical protein
MTRQEFNIALSKALTLKGRTRQLDDTLIDYAWREIGHGQSDGFIRTALKDLAYSKESNLPTAFEQARIHAYQQAKQERADQVTGCPDCAGGWHYMRTMRHVAVWRTGGAKQTQALDKPTATLVAYRCPTCNGGRVRHQEVPDGMAYDEMSGRITHE